MGTAGDPADPADPGHGAWCTTPGTLAPEVKMTVVLNKLPQISFQTHVYDFEDLETIQTLALAPICRRAFEIHLPIYVTKS